MAGIVGPTVQFQPENQQIIGSHPLDWGMVAIDNTLIVIRKDGTVWGADVLGNQIQQPRQFIGPDRIGQNWPFDKFVVALEKPFSSPRPFLLAVICADGNVYGADILPGDRPLGPVYKLFADPIASNEGDWGMVAAHSTLIVIRKDGTLWGSEYGITQLTRFSGHSMPTNQIGQNWPIDKFVVIFKKPNSSIQDFVLAVIRHDDGTVWGADINNVFMTLGPVTQFRRHSGGSIGNGAADKFMVAFRHESDTWEHLDGSPLLHRRSGRLAVFLTDGRAFFNEIVDL